MQGYDILMLIVLVAATAWGAHKGLAWQIASLASIVVSYFVSLRLRESVSHMMPAEAPWNMLLAMLAVYLACSLGIWIAFRFVSDIINRVKLKEFDRQIGGLLGFAKGVALCVIITLFAVTLTGDRTRQEIIHSKSGRYISTLLSQSYAWVPNEARQVVTPYLDQWNRQLQGEGGQPPTTASDQMTSDSNSTDGWGLLKDKKLSDKDWQAVEDNLRSRIEDFRRQR
jgi:membrane protein required for colicin V production